MKQFYLTPIDGRRSFYNKCYVAEDIKSAILFSYNTKICTLYFSGNRVIYESGFKDSKTTRRHIKAFLSFYDVA